jgi:WD40 repeat protein
MVYKVKITILSQQLMVKHTGVLSGHRGAVYAMCRAAKSDVFYSSGGDGWIVAWPASGQISDGSLIAQTDSGVFCLALQPDENYLVAGDMNGHIYWINLEEKNITARVAWHTRSVFALEFTPYGLLSAAGDGILCLWDPVSRLPLMSVQLSAQGLRCLAFDPESERVYVGASDNAVYVWNVAAWRLEHTISRAHENSVFSLLITTAGRLLSGGRDAQLCAWDTSSMQNIKRLPAHWFTINNIISMEGTPYLATASRDKSIRIWQRETLEPVLTLDAMKGGHVNSVNSLLWIPDRNTLISCGDDRLIRLWSVSE